MTFYNLISAILFLGACRQLIVAIESFNLNSFFMAATFVLLVFNDAVFTSHVTEGDRPVEYSLKLKLIDLINFLILITALLIINPKNNMFGVDVSNLSVWLRSWLFWFLLGIYWILINVWTAHSGIYHRDGLGSTVGFITH